MKGLLIISFALLAVVMLVAGCGTSVNIRPEGASESDSAKKLPKLSFNSVSIEIKTEVEDSQDAVEMFNKFLTESFKEKNVRVVAPGTAVDAKMTIAIKYFKKVSKTSKFFLGPLTGAAELKAEVLIITVKNKFNFLLDSSAIDNMGDASWWVGRSGSTDDLLERTSKKITEEILL